MFSPEKFNHLELFHARLKLSPVENLNSRIIPPPQKKKKMYAYYPIANTTRKQQSKFS